MKEGMLVQWLKCCEELGLAGNGVESTEEASKLFCFWTLPPHSHPPQKHQKIDLGQGPSVWGGSERPCVHSGF